MKMFALEYVGVGALLLVPLAPLAVYLGFLFPYISGRNFLFRTLTLIALACWLLLWIRKPTRYRLRPSFLVWAVLAFTTIVGIATVLAPNPPFAFWSTLERMDGLVSVLFIGAFFFSAHALFDAHRWAVFWNVSLGAALAASFVALLQLAGVLAIHQGGVRIDASFGNAAFFAAYMLLSTGLALFLAAGAESRRIRILYLASPVFFLFLMLASATRSALIALPVALFASAIAAFFLGRKHLALRRFGALSLIALALGAGAFFIAREIPALRAHPLIGRLLLVSFSGQDAHARLLAWKIAWDGFTEQPLLGWGPEGYRFVFAKYYDPRLAGREQWFDRAHNNYLDILVQTGALGLLAYLALWVGLLRAIFRGGAFSAREKVALTGLLTAYAAFNVFAFDTITTSLIFFALLAYADVRLRELRRAHFEKLSPPPHQNAVASPPPQFFKMPRLRSLCSVLIVTVTLFIFYSVIAKPAYAAYLIHEGLRNNSPDLDTRLAFFTRAITLRTIATPEAREFLAQFATDVEPVLVREESREKMVSLVEEELALQIAASPEDPRYPLRLGVVLNAYGKYAEAVPYLEQAIVLSPHKQPTLYELGTSFLNLGKMNEAVEVFKHTADLLPGVQDLESKKLYVVALIYARRFAEAEAYMQEVFNAPLFYDSRLADAYRRVGRPDTAEHIMENIR